MTGGFVHKGRRVYSLRYRLECPPPQIMELVVALGQELTEAGADWQIHAFGHVRHGFTNPNADKIGLDAVRYNALAAERSWTSFISLLEELFG